MEPDDLIVPEAPLEIVKPPKAKSPWNSLEVAKLVASLVTPLAVLWIGYVFNASTKAADDRRAQQLRDAEAVHSREAAVIDLSRFIYERRIVAIQLAAALGRDSKSSPTAYRAEIIERKRDYDLNFVTWNTNSQAFLLQVRSTLAAKSYSHFEGIIETRLVQQTFGPLDICLTNAFETAVRDGDPRPIMDSCGAGALMQRALDCGYSITNDLYLASLSLDTDAETEDRKFSKDIDRRCPDTRSVKHTP